MHDRELYRQILGIQAPWEVSEVEVEVDLAGTGDHCPHPSFRSGSGLPAVRGGVLRLRHSRA